MKERPFPRKTRYGINIEVSHSCKQEEFNVRHEGVANVNIVGVKDFQIVGSDIVFSFGPKMTLCLPRHPCKARRRRKQDDCCCCTTLT